MHYSHALDLIFESYIAAKPRLKGKLDRDVRNPHLILDMARKMNLLPPANKVLKVTGSKGKGSVARLCAHALQTETKVGLLISPEEIEHLDRMRINGQAISEDRFIACFNTIWSQVEAPVAPDYLSPYGLFLLIALQWFKEEEVDLLVIETGRGVKFDEGGQLPAKTGVVTSIFFEHPDYLGPTLEDIRRDKLSIADTCENLVIGATSVADTDHQRMPEWYRLSKATAFEALRAFTGQAIPVPDCDCASFGMRQIGQCTYYFEGMIASQSADRAFLQQLLHDHNGQVRFYVSLPDDKDIDGICTLLDDIKGTVEHIILTGERGFLSYEQAKKHKVAYEGPFNDVEALRTNLNLPTTGAVYFIGTQTYLRLIKRAYFS